MKSLGIIGCGAVVQNSYIEALGKHSDIKVNFVFDLNKDLADSLASQVNAKSVEKEELINGSEIIVIATPPSSHYSLIKEVFRPKKKIICEKPFVGTLKECNELVFAAKQVDAQLFVAHFRRYFPSVQLAHSLIRSNTIGKITAIEMYEGGKFSWQTKSGYVYKDPFGGVLFDTGSHTIDMALFMTGLDLEEDFSIKQKQLKKDKIEPAHEVEAKMEIIAGSSVIDFTLKLSRRSILANKIRVIGENGFIDVPTAMSNRLRLTGSNGLSTVLYSPHSYAYYNDCFASQFKEMFYDVKDSIFVASRFRNLTNILQIIAEN